MLEKVRKPGRAKSIIAYIIFGAICVVFIFLGVTPDDMGVSSSGPAAIVNKVPISIGDYQDAYNNLQQQYKGQLDFLPAAQRQMYTQDIRSRALEMLITSEVVAQAATGLGVHSADEAVRDYIVRIPAFKKEDKFRRDLYDGYLAYRGLSADKFESEVRKDLAREGVRELMQSALATPEAEQELDRGLAAVSINLSFIGVNENSIAPEPTPAEVSHALEKAENQQAIKDFFVTHKGEYAQPEEVKARHILVKIDSTQADSDKKALAKIEELRKELTSKDFAELAKQYSDDPGSKDNGGDLGFFPRGRMAPEFENVAFASEIGKVSEPVKTQFGYHLIKVEEKRAAGQKDFEQVKNEVTLKWLREQNVKQTKANLGEWLKNQDVAALNRWATKLNLKWEETGDFKLNAPGVPKIGSADEIVLAVAKQKKAGSLVPDAITVNNKIFAVQIKSIKEEKLAELPKIVDDRFNIRSAQVVNEVFGQWAEKYKESAKIVRNQALVSR